MNHWEEDSPHSAGHGTPTRETRPDADLRTDPGRALPPNRADLVLFLGILSLFLCGPLGLAAWIIGSSDLRRIRGGGMSAAKRGLLRVGTSLGALGTVLFVVAITFGVMMFQRGVIGNDFNFRAEPLKADQVIFAGEWHGRKGTLIRITEEGTGDFQSRHTSLTGGRVEITKDSISIGMLGLSKTWHIDRRPSLKDGNWTMELDGEEFVRTGTDLLV